MRIFNLIRAIVLSLLVFTRGTTVSVYELLPLLTGILVKCGTR